DELAPHGPLKDLSAGSDSRVHIEDPASDQYAQRINEGLAMGGGGDEEHLRVAARVAGVEQLARGTQPERLAHRATALEPGKGNRQREVHVDVREHRTEISCLAMVRIAMKQRDPKAAVGGIDQ